MSTSLDIVQASQNLVFFKVSTFSTLTSTQKYFDNYKISCKGKFSQIDENEISMLKEKIDSLGVVLKKCEFDKTRLEAMFSKKHVPKNHSNAIHTHAHKSQPLHHAKHPKHPHTQHTPHTHHAFMYGKVFSCTYCGRKGHLVKFCYDRLNASHNNV